MVYDNAISQLLCGDHEADASSLVHLVCNHLSLGQWELGRAALAHLVLKNGDSGRDRAAQILREVATAPPAHWLPPLSTQQFSGACEGCGTDSGLPSLCQLPWWALVQAQELLGTDECAWIVALRPRAQLLASVGAVFPDASPVQGFGIGEQAIFDKCRCILRESWDDTMAIRRVVSLCSQVRKSELDDGSELAGLAPLSTLPLHIALEWAQRSLPLNGNSWSALWRAWDGASEETMVRLRSLPAFLPSPPC